MCTSILCGRDATADHSVLIARNEDFPKNLWNKYMVYRKHPPFSATDNELVLGNGLRVPVPENWYPYGAMPDADGQSEMPNNVGERFCYEARGINTRHVALSATNSVQMNDLASAADPLVANGVEESNIVTLILPQAESARGAVELLGNYVSQYGASEANGVLMADELEAWYMEIGSAHHWIAVRVPDDAYLVVSNSMRVHGVNLDDADCVIASQGLYEFVEHHRLLKHPNRNSFDFASAFGQQEKNEDGNKDPYYNVDRLWLAQSILSPSQKPQLRQHTYPLFLKPDKPVTPSKVMEVLRSVFTGTPLEHMEGATRPIGVVRTAESHILTLDQTMPGALKGTIWQAIGSPLGSAYIPFYAQTDAIPEEYACGDSVHFEKRSVYWLWKSLFALCDQMDCLDDLIAFRDTYEQQCVKEEAESRMLLRKIAAEDAELAESLAKTISVGRLEKLAQAVSKKWDEVLANLISEQQDRNLVIDNTIAF